MNRLKNIKRSGGFRRKVQQYLKANEKNAQLTQCMAQSVQSIVHPNEHSASNTSLNMELPQCALQLTDHTNKQSTSTILSNTTQLLETQNPATELDNSEPQCEINQMESNSDDTDDEENEDNVHTFRMNLRQWSVNHGITQSATNDLLRIINLFQPATVPKDARTLLQVAKYVEIQKICNGEYWHHGLRTNLEKHFQNLSENITVNMDVNMDGLPTCKSSKVEFWPILVKIHDMPSIPVLVIGIYCRNGKPSDVNQFLNPFVMEVLDIIRKPLEINNFQLSVKVRAIICDSPARAFIKGIGNFNSQNGCPKCTTTGEYSYVSHCNIFPRHDCPPRTDEGFRNKIYGSHHKVDSALLQLPIDMILDVPVSDSLHLIDLGIMKRCLMGWRDGSFSSYKTKWRAADITNLSHILLQCKLPKEIHRKVRGLDTVAFWKASEFRSFLHYLSIVVLKQYLQRDAYDHFLILFCAVTICSSEAYDHLLNIAQDLFNTYIEYYRDIYGEAHMTSNVHNLCHVVEEVKRFGILSSFNAYPFENTLYHIKRLLRTGYKPLQQVAKRLIENSNIEIDIKQATNTQEYPRPRKIMKPLDNFNYSLLATETEDKSKVFFYNQFDLKNYFLSTSSPDCWVLTTKNEIIKLKCLITVHNNHYFFGASLNKKQSFFDRPFQSSHLNIYVSNLVFDVSFSLYKIEEIKCKLVSINYESNKIVFIPLIHTLKY